MRGAALEDIVEETLCHYSLTARYAVLWSRWVQAEGITWPVNHQRTLCWTESRFEDAANFGF